MNLKLLVARMGLVGGMLLAISVNASGADRKIFGYVGLKGGYSQQIIGQGVSIAGTSGAGAPPASGAVSVPDYTTPAMPIGAVAGVGYYLAPKLGVRLEGEYLYRLSLSSANLKVNQGAGAPATLDKMNIFTNASSALANVYVDYYMLPRVNVYLGAGIGAGILNTNLKLVNAQGGTNKIQENKVSFAWQFGGGVGLSLTQHIKLDLGVRFINFDKAAINTAPLNQTSPTIPAGLLSFGITNIEALMGLNYQF